MRTRLLSLWVTGILIFFIGGPATAATIDLGDFSSSAITYDFSADAIGETMVGDSTISITAGTVVSNDFHGQTPPTYLSYEGIESFLRFDFFNPVSALGMDVWAVDSKFTLLLFDNSNSLLEESTFEFYPFQQGFTFGFIGLDFGSDLIDYAVLMTDKEIPFSVDNIIYQQAGSPVPEPSTMILLGAGLIGFAGLGRKTKKF